MGLAVALATLGVAVVGPAPQQATAQQQTQGAAEASETPRRDSFTKLAEGLYARAVYGVEGFEPRVELWQVILAPGETSPRSFPGGVVFEVVAGDVVVLEPERAEVKTGGTFAVAQGDALRLRNPGETPVRMRAVLVGKREP